MGRTLKRIIARAKQTIEVIPFANWLPCHIVQHPAIARIHTALTDLMPQQVVVIYHDLPPQSIRHRSLIALKIQFHPRFIVLSRTIRRESVIGDRQKRPRQGIQMGNGRCIRMFCC